MTVDRLPQPTSTAFFGNGEIMLTYEGLRAELTYNPNNGEFLRIRTQRRTFNSSLSTCGAYYPADMLAFLYMLGEHYEGRFVHLNGLGHDRRFENLRVYVGLPKGYTETPAGSGVFVHRKIWGRTVKYAPAEHPNVWRKIDCAI